MTASGSQAPAREDFGLAGRDPRRNDKHLGRLQALQALKINLLFQEIPQRVDVKRVALIGRYRAGPEVAHGVGPGGGQRVVGNVPSEQGVEGRALGLGQGSQANNAIPEAGQDFPGDLGGIGIRSALDAGKAARQGNGVHGAGTGAADPLERDATDFQQRIEHTPGEGAMGAAALECQVDAGSAGCSGRPKAQEVFESLLEPDSKGSW